ncbi:MAG: hypothetical protein U0324_14550 [Polyangiales bacterium]
MRNALAFVLLASCAGAASSAPSSDAAPADAAAPGDAADVTAPPADSAVLPADATPADVAATPDADPRAPSPPAGARRCGEGAITAAEFMTSCMSPSSVVDRTLLPDGGMGSIERQCGAVTVSGGRWEAWCGAEQVYVWARFEGVRATGTYVACGAATSLAVGLGYAEYALGGAGGGGTANARGVPDYFFDQTRPTDVVMDYTVRATRAGSGRFLIGASLAVQCVGMMPTGGPGPNVIVGGTAFRWDPAAM